MQRIIIRFNSFAHGEYLGCEGACGDPDGRLRVVGNIFGSGAVCIRGARYRDNLSSLPDQDGQIARTSVFGYTYRDGRLLIDPREADAVKTAFAEVGRSTFRSLRVVARRLSKRQKVAPAGGWTPATVRAIVSDSLYLGRRLGIQARHQRLVPPYQWKKAQRVGGHRRMIGPARRATGVDRSAASSSEVPGARLRRNLAHCRPDAYSVDVLPGSARSRLGRSRATRGVSEGL